MTSWVVNGIGKLNRYPIRKIALNPTDPNPNLIVTRTHSDPNQNVNVISINSVTY